MDAFLTRLSYHATSYAIRSCLALTSTYVIQQGSKLIKTVNDDPLRAELGQLQKRLARKIELISPILESIEFRYTRGNAALEAVVGVSRELREDIDALAKRLEAAAVLGTPSKHETEKGPAKAAKHHAELLGIVAEIKELIVSIDDAIPLVNLWVSAIGGVQTQPSSFSPSRLLQASMLVNVGDMQYILDPGQPMQIGPDFTLSLYMLFRGHASQDGEPYGIEDGQRKPTWQEVVHKARVRLYRVPPSADYTSVDADGYQSPQIAYTYRLHMVEDLDDGRVHTFEDGNEELGPYDGVSLAGIREVVPVGQISKMSYIDVGRILNINNEDGASSNPVLLLKRDIQTSILGESTEPTEVGQQGMRLMPDMDSQSIISDATFSESDPQDDIDRQLREESQPRELDPVPLGTPVPAVQAKGTLNSYWSLPHNLDPEWMALEVFDIDDTDSSSSDDELTAEEAEAPEDTRHRAPQNTPRTSVDSNLLTQFQRMSLATNSSSVPSSPLPSFRDSHTHASTKPQLPSTLTTPARRHHRQPSLPLSPTIIERSPFGAIKTSLSLLEMLLRLASLQEFEQTTHLAVSDYVLKFYLDESASESGLHGKERWAARAEAARKVGFDPYTDAPGGLS